MLRTLLQLAKLINTSKIHHFGLFEGTGNAAEKEAITWQTIVASAKNYEEGNGIYSLLDLAEDDGFTFDNSGACNWMIEKGYLVTSQTDNETRVHLTAKLLLKVLEHASKQDALPNPALGISIAPPAQQLLPSQG